MDISSLTNIPIEVVTEYIALMQNIHSHHIFQTFFATYEECALTMGECQENSMEADFKFLRDLEENHDFSKAKSRMYLEMLRQLKEQTLQLQRKPESVVYYAVSPEESAGKALNECRLIPVQLSWWTREDQAITNLDSTKKLKWQKIVRFATEAHQQGACLNQADLAYLLAIHPGVIQQKMKEHENIFLPSRGNVVDMGPGLTHAEKLSSFIFKDIRKQRLYDVRDILMPVLKITS